MRRLTASLSLLVLMLVGGCVSPLTGQKITANGIEANNTPGDQAEFSVEMVRNPETGELEMGAPKIRQQYIKNTPTPIMADNDGMWIGDTGPASTVVIPGWGLMRVAQDGQIASIKRPILDPTGAPYRDPAGNPIYVEVNGLEFKSSPVITAFDTQVQAALAATAELGPEQRMVEIEKMVMLGKIPPAVGEAAGNIIRAAAGLP